MNEEPHFHAPEVIPPARTIQPEMEPDLSIPPPPGFDRPRPAPPPPSAAPPPRDHTPRRRVMPPTWALLLVMLGVCLIATVAVAAILQAVPAMLPQALPQATGGAESSTVEKVLTFLSPPTIAPDASVVQEGETPLHTINPNQLHLGDMIYPVIPVAPDQGRWPMPATQYDMAVWIHGTVINYVVGLPYTATTASRLTGLTDSDRITLTLDNGTALVFGAPQAQYIAADDLSPMQQQRPGLTLVTLGSYENTRLVVRARYLPEESLSAENQQRVEGIAIEQLKAGVTQENNDTRYFVVEYRISNETASAVDPTYFDLVLEDKEGQRYPLHDQATASGEHGALTRSIQAGEIVTGSAGYLVPRDMQPPITWLFRADPASPNAARYILPYEAPLPRPALPDVELQSVFADGRRDVIVVNGTIYNDGETALNVTLNDIALSYGMRPSSLQASTPLLPWTVNGGEQQKFELQFSRPTGTEALTLEILGFVFEIEGMP